MAESRPHFEPPRLIVLMGVAGCGKSTVGPVLANAIAGEYLDGDTFHPPANIEKMTQGIPLEDDDRWPWLEKIGTVMSQSKGRLIVGCSALRRRYRNYIRSITGHPIVFVHLAGSPEVIARRMSERDGHFMPTSLLNSQFAALEPPVLGEPAIEVAIDQPLDRLVDEIVRRLKENEHDR